MLTFDFDGRVHDAEAQLQALFISGWQQRDQLRRHLQQTLPDLRIATGQASVLMQADWQKFKGHA